MAPGAPAITLDQDVDIVRARYAQSNLPHGTRAEH
jgi:hypothetical protein